MNKIYIGKITTTHGIKGEIKILSDFECKDIAFSIGNTIIIDNTNYKITSHRVHKGLDMITLSGFNNINDVLFLKGKRVYSPKDYYKNIMLMSDYIGLEVKTKDKSYGVVVDYDNGINPLLKVKYNRLFYYIPIKSNFIINTTSFILVNDNIEELII